MSLTALPVTVALTTDGSVDPQTLPEVARALNLQVHRDFDPYWHIRASVVPYPDVTAIPTSADVWPLVITTQDAQAGAAGFHDSGTVPYALVDPSAGNWTVTASHELLEMLADPWGRRLWKAPAPDGSVVVSYLVEVGDPVEAASYLIGGVSVSDFVCPAWYHGARHPGDKLDFLGITNTPRTITRGGYVSWLSGGQWYQETWFGDSPATAPLGAHADIVTGCESYRQAVDRLTRGSSRPFVGTVPQT